MNWQEQATVSHYQTAVAIRERLRAGQVAEAAGLEELIEALSRSERRALKTHLIRLMMHVIQWQLHPDRRSRSWLASIRNARKEIRAIQAETPSLINEVLASLWADCWESACDQAAGEMDQDVELPPASWDDLFQTEYTLPPRDDN